MIIVKYHVETVRMVIYILCTATAIVIIVIRKAICTPRLLLHG
jgi:hypothetical protein